MSWDVTSPAGTDAISGGDDSIRTLKTDLQTALRGNAADGTEAKFPGADTANPVFRYRGLKGTTGSRPAAGQYGLYMNTTLNTIQRDNGTTWDDVATLIPSGTVMVFYQASAPTGWTAVALNDKFLRVVTAGGTGGTTGGTVAASTNLNHTHTMGNHTHSTPNHSHTLQNTAVANLASAGGTRITYDGSDGLTTSGGAGTEPQLSRGTSSGGSGTSGTPSSNTSDASTALGVLAYADIVVGTKD